jgi:hypothetical protein
MKESILWRKLRDGTSSLDIHWTRLESWASPGVPDVHGFYQSYDLWIELKVMRSSTIKVRPHQISWHYSRQRAGGSSFILIGDPGRRIMNLYTGAVVRELSVPSSVSSIPLIWTSPTRNCDWRSMIVAMCSVIDDQRSRPKDCDNMDNKDVA